MAAIINAIGNQEQYQGSVFEKYERRFVGNGIEMQKLIVTEIEAKVQMFKSCQKCFHFEGKLDVNGKKRSENCTSCGLCPIAAAHKNALDRIAVTREADRLVEEMRERMRIQEETKKVEEYVNLAFMLIDTVLSGPSRDVIRKAIEERRTK